jgi:tetratricopeptide (TPR) repeat protein
MAISPYPTEEALRAFVLGELAEPQAGAIARHLDDCPRCEQAAEQLETRTDPVVAVLRQVPRPGPAEGAVPSFPPTWLASPGWAAPRPARPSVVPRLVAGYEILEELGRGGMGVIFKARHTQLNRIVALKMVRDAAQASSEQRLRFRIDAERVAWHERAAGEAERAGRLFAARWHLDRLVALRRDSATYLRRAHVHALAGDFDAAGADHARALALGPVQRVRDAQRRLATWALDRKEWALAVWYHDCLIEAFHREWQLYAARADALRWLGRFERREEDLRAAAAHGAGRDFLARFADEEAEDGRHCQAAYLYALADRPDVLNLALSHRRALVHLRMGDRAGYRRLCDGALQAVRGRPLDYRQADAIARLCGLGPDGVADWEEPVRLSRGALEVVARLRGEPATLARFRHDWRNTLGLVLYRAGRPRQALRQIEAGLKIHGGGGSVEDWLVLALVQHRLGKPGEARRWLARVRGWLDRPPDETPWQQALLIKVLYDEAEALLGGH